MRFQALTIFPELFGAFRDAGLVGRAVREGIVSLDVRQLRELAINRQGQLDDTPYGGGSGMVLRPEPAAKAISDARAADPGARVVLLTPRGRPLTQRLARSLANDRRGIIFLCCRYEGVDERVAETMVDLELSVGDYVLMGGEVPAMLVMEAVTRLLPGVLGNPESAVEESFEAGILEHPHYTKPPVFEGCEVPEVLLSGNHAAIAAWRKDAARRDTRARRPDLLWQSEAPDCEISVALVHYPVLNKQGETITSSVTNLDVHDIARSARTFGLARFYIVHPTRALRRLTERICEHWETGYGLTYNPNRSDALRTVTVVPDFDDVILDIESRTGELPAVVTTSARDDARSRTFEEMKQVLYGSVRPHLIVLGTGWGLTEAVLDRADHHLAPVKGFSDYNHLSVRAAAAIIFDRLLGAPSASAVEAGLGVSSA